MAETKIADEKTDLRRGIDHIGVGVCCIVHDGNGNILMMQRGQQARDERGKWDIIGGAIEFGESIDEALRRELQEEICTDPLDVVFIGHYDAHREHEGNKTHWVQLIHAVRVDPATVKIGEPHKIAQLGWFSPDSLPEPRHSQFHKAYALAVNAGLFPDSTQHESL